MLVAAVVVVAACSDDGDSDEAATTTTGAESATTTTAAPPSPPEPGEPNTAVIVFEDGESATVPVTCELEASEVIENQAYTVGTGDEEPTPPSA